MICIETERFFHKNLQPSLTPRKSVSIPRNTLFIRHTGIFTWPDINYENEDSVLFGAQGFVILSQLKLKRIENLLQINFKFDVEWGESVTAAFCDIFYR